MKLEDIFDMWDRDSQIHESQLAETAMDQAKLHSKYYRILSEERLILQKMEQDYNKLVKDKHSWLSGNMEQEKLKELGWEQNKLRILNKDLDMHIKADQDIINFNLRLAIAKEKVEALKSIVTMITYRNNACKTALDTLKFRAGER